jgi:hypothetical protein
MNLKVTGEVIVTHENPRTGERIEDQRQQITYRIDLRELAGLIDPLVDLVAQRIASLERVEA